MDLVAGQNCYFAYCYPYTSTELNQDIAVYMQRSKNIQRSLLCKTLAGNRVEVLTITDRSASIKEIAKRKGVIFIARVHPGESNGSFVMKGILEFLTSENN